MEILISKLEIKKYKSFGTLILWLFTFWSTTGYNSKTISERWTIVKSANYALNVSRNFAIPTPQNGPKNVAQPIKNTFLGQGWSSTRWQPWRLEEWMIIANGRRTTRSISWLLKVEMHAYTHYTVVSPAIRECSDDKAELTHHLGGGAHRSITVG